MTNKYVDVEGMRQFIQLLKESGSGSGVDTALLNALESRITQIEKDMYVYQTDLSNWQNSNITSGSYYSIPAVLSDDTLVIGSRNDTGVKYCEPVKKVAWAAS